MPSQKLIVDAILRHVHPDSVEAVAERIRLANDSNVLPRPLSEYRKASELGTLFVVEVDNEIHAVSGIFDSGDESYRECGGTLVLTSVRGFGLQEVLFRVRMAAAVIATPGTALVTGIKSTNRHSLGNMKSARFSPWDAPSAALFEACVTCASRPAMNDRRCCCDFYILSKDDHAAGIRELLQYPEILTRTRSNGDVMRLSLKVNVVTEESYRAALQDFVDGVPSSP